MTKGLQESRLKAFLLEGRKILRLRNPVEQRKRWEQWKNGLKALPVPSELGLSLRFDQLSWDLTRLERLFSPPETIATKVYVVHGRNDSARQTMFSFLHAVGLEPIEWLEAIELTIKSTGDLNPYVGAILDTAFSNAQAIVVLMTGDDLARLGTRFIAAGAPNEELTPQARPNVIFEAGLALGRHPHRTIVVEFGTLRHISDLAGKHAVRMDGSVEKRQELVTRLRAAGCKVRTEDKTEWLTIGDFNSVIVYPDKR